MPNLHSDINRKNFQLSVAVNLQNFIKLKMSSTCSIQMESKITNHRIEFKIKENVTMQCPYFKNKNVVKDIP